MFTWSKMGLTGDDFEIVEVGQGYHPEIDDDSPNGSDGMSSDDDDMVLIQTNSMRARGRPRAKSTSSLLASCVSKLAAGVTVSNPTPGSKPDAKPALRKTLSGGDIEVLDNGGSDHNHIYSCKNCGIHIGLEKEIESRSYQVGEGKFTERKRGYLFKAAVNLKEGPVCMERFTTGVYDIRHVTCKSCEVQLGWRYTRASTNEGKMKIGKYCISRFLLTTDD